MAIIGPKRDKYEFREGYVWNDYAACWELPCDLPPCKCPHVPPCNPDHIDCETCDEQGCEYNILEENSET